MPGLNYAESKRANKLIDQTRMRITQPFVGSGMKTNSLDPPPTISYFEYQAKLLWFCDSVTLFLSDCDILNVNPIMASQFSLYTTGDHLFFITGRTNFFLFCMEKGGKQTKDTNGSTVESWHPFDDTEFSIYSFFLCITDKGDTKKERKTGDVPFFLLCYLFHHFLTHLPDSVCCGPNGLSVV